MALREEADHELGTSLAKSKSKPQKLSKDGVEPVGGSKIMDLRPSHGLAAGLKRTGGRKGIARLGNYAKHGRPLISHKY
jgi:hypothetical protein